DLQQFWNTVPPGGFPSTFGTINRTGLTTIGNTSQYPLFASTNANPVPLQVRGNNIILSKVFDQTDFAALGQSGAGEAECDLWGFRAQRFFDRSVSLGVTPQGDNRAILNWGSDIKQLVFTTGSNGDCGNQVASFTIEGIRFFVPLLPGRIYVPAAEVEVDQQIEKALGDATDRIMALAPIRVESEEKLKGSEGLSYSSTDELEIDVNSLETFVPEAVATDSDGNKMVDYNEVVPLLVATLQEQQAMIDQQQALLQDMMNRLDQLDGEEAEVLEVEGAFLGQNIPNPAFNSTSIEYQLPDGAENGELVVRNVAGQVILSESLATKTGSQSIDLNNLSPGTYIYSLQVNGRVMFSKRMIVQ
ncbi:MAG: T9SS type A sorting domain-containing protein, partial [Bacteroidota bacterium]